MPEVTAEMIEDIMARPLGARLWVGRGFGSDWWLMRTKTGFRLTSGDFGRTI